MLICACPASISWRLLSTEQSSFFFQPVQLYFELPDLLVEFVLQLCFRSLRSFAAIAKRLLQMLECLLLPLPNLVGMHAVVRRDLVHAAHTLDRFQRHFALQSRAVLPPLFAHRSSARAPILHLIHLSSFWGVAHSCQSMMKKSTLTRVSTVSFRSISRETAHHFRNYATPVFCDSGNHYQPWKKSGAKAAGKESSVSAV